VTPETTRIRRKLRRHVLTCEDCEPDQGVYCRKVQADAERFAELRRDEVLAERLERR